MRASYTTRVITFAELVEEINKISEQLNSRELLKPEADRAAPHEPVDLPSDDCGGLEFTFRIDPSNKQLATLAKTALLDDDDYLYLFERMSEGYLDATKQLKVYFRVLARCVKTESINTKSKWAKALNADDPMAEVLQNLVATLVIFYYLQITESEGKLAAPLPAETNTEAND